MKTIVRLRQASLDDLNVIHAIRRDAILGIESESVAQPACQIWADRRPADFYANRVEAGEVMIAMSDSEAVGWGSVSKDSVTGLYVRPSVGLRGIGRQIVFSLEARIVQRGYLFARLESSPNAVGFYEALGYLAMGLPNDDGAVSMRKDLQTPDIH